MRTATIALVALSVVAVTGAAAQGIDLSGRYSCIQNCRGPGPIFVTQNGWDLNLSNEVGQASRAWIDWPGHIWAQAWEEGAVVSPDGMTIQFDHGAVWQREFSAPPPPPLRAKN